MTAPELHFPLVDSSYDNQEIISCIETLVGGQLTMGARVREFEQKFADYCGAPHAVMVNSGSSANLLALAAATNPLRAARLMPGDKVAIPAVCWSTSMWPIIQMGLVPVLVDVDPVTLNLSIDSLKQALRLHPIKAVMMVHVLGNSTDVSALLEVVRNEGLLLIEDTCEALGSGFEQRKLGTLGAFGTFSFYFSHHMTTIEGGMVLAQTTADADLLRCLRSHGWSRDQSNRAALEQDNPAIDPRFLFINLGFNLRPMEIQAAFGLQQLQRLDQMNAQRRANVRQIHAAFRTHSQWRGQLHFPQSHRGVDPSWFGLPFLVDAGLNFDYRQLTRLLLDVGIDTRPIVSGNMALQPALRHLPHDQSLGPFHGAQAVHDRGMFIGCHAKPLADTTVAHLVERVLGCLEAASQ